METKILTIGDKKYFSIVDDLGVSMVNLTHNDIFVNIVNSENLDAPKNIILKSNFPVNLLFMSSIPRVTGVPHSRTNTFFIVESCVKAAISRTDFCRSANVLEVGEFDEYACEVFYKYYFLPIF